MPRRLTALAVAIGCFGTACSSSHPRSSSTIAATSTTSPVDACAVPPSTATTRSAVICDVDFAPGAVLYVEVHPDAQPIELATSEPGYAACPGEASYRAFNACIPIDAQRGATLPSTGTNMMHIGWMLRRTDASAARLGSLRITYDAVDRHFVVRPPSTAAASTIVGFTPVSSDLVGASAYGQDSRPADATLTCTQAGRVLATAPVEHGEVEGSVACTHATLGTPVHVQLARAGSPPSGVQMLLEWK